jgi:hypothetical protein
MSGGDAMGSRRGWTIEQVRALGVTTSIVTAGSVLGIGRSTAYALARSGQFPVPVIRIGTRYVVPVPALLKALHADGPEPDTTARLDPPSDPRVHGTPAGSGLHPPRRTSPPRPWR